MNLAIEVIKVILSLSFVIFLLILVLRLGEGKLKTIQNKKYVKILDKTSLSKESSIVVAKMGENAYVLSVTRNNISILKELSNEELLNMENLKVEKENSNRENYDKLIKIFRDKLKIKGR